MKVHGFATSAIACVLMAAGAHSASAQESIIYSFGQFADGREPASAPLFDAAGNMYGCAVSGGLPGEPYFNTNGIVWKLTPAAGGTWTETVLYNFGTVAGDGANPSGSLIFDAAGNLYGTAAAGGANGLGIVFELSPGASAGGAWTEKVLYSFQGGTTDGASPERVTLVRDEAGNLYGTTKFGGAYGSNSSGGTVFELSPVSGGTWKEKLIHSFGSGTDGAQPVAGVTLDASGNLYGTTLVGGQYAEGTVFEVSPASGSTWTEKVLHSFDENGVDGKNPYDPVLLDSRGNLYGTTYGGGANPEFLGIIFELSPSASGEWTEQVLHTFTGDPDGTAPVPDGDFPYGGLVSDAAGNLYGATSGGGTAGNGGVFVITPGPGGWTEKLLYSFGASSSDGHSPAAMLGFDASGNLYGTTLSGGANSFGLYGAVFKIAGVTAAQPKFSPAPGAYAAAQKVTISVATSAASIYYTLNGSTSPIQYTAPVSVTSSSIITAYATSPTLPRSPSATAGYQIGSVVATPEISPAGGTYTVAQSVTIADADPGATIYYTTNGTVPTTSATKYAGPIAVTATQTIKAVATATGLTESAVASAEYTITPITPPQEAVLYSFGASATDGTVPSAGVIFSSAGDLFGTTTDGGANKKGTVFELLPATGGGWTEKILYSFGATGADAASPNAALVFDSKGNLYGTTAQGGTIGMGTVFELSPSASGAWTEKVLWNFGLTITDGEVPEAGLIFDSKGNLYGTTSQGGANTTWAAGSGGWGTVFELSPTTSGPWTEKILYAFGYLSRTDGYFPTAGVIFDSAGNLYGTTSDGGSGQDLDGGGTVFELSPTTTGPWKQTVLYSFGGGSPNGYSPEGGLVRDAAGNLYGTAHSGGNGFGLDGTVFEISPQSGGGWSEIVLHSFGAYETDGINPTSTLLFDAKGNLYGTTYAGGANQAGIVYELTPQSEGGWTEQALDNFGATATDAMHPFAGLIFDSAGRLYGTTQFGGAHGSASTGGTVFEIKTSATVGTTTPADASLTPKSLTFPSTPVGSTSAAQVVTVTNSGGSTLTFNTNPITFTGTAASSFTETTTCGSSLAAGASCTISVSMKPAVVGSLAATLNLADNSSGGSPQQVALTGAGTAAVPVLTVTPTSLAFLSTVVGYASPAQIITLENTGKLTATLVSIKVTGAKATSFYQLNTCGASIAPGGICYIMAAFKPTAVGSSTAAVTITDNAAGSPQSVTLSGTGIAVPTVTLSATTLTFASTAIGTTSQAQSVTLTNKGTSPLTINSISLTGTNASSFIQANNCLSPLAAGAACTIFVALDPAAAGTLKATLTISDNASITPQSVALTGTGH